ncbi:MAG: DUF1573 domain-containing protein [Vampirovibrionales bacterium]
MNRQRLLILLALVLLAGLSTGLFALWEKQQGLARSISASQARFQARSATNPHRFADLRHGDHPRRGRGAYTLTIQNLGGEPLVIDHVDTSCGCTLLNLKDKGDCAGKQGELGL